MILWATAGENMRIGSMDLQQKDSRMTPLLHSAHQKLFIFNILLLILQVCNYTTIITKKLFVA